MTVFETWEIMNPISKDIVSLGFIIDEFVLFVNKGRQRKTRRRRGALVLRRPTVRASGEGAQESVGVRTGVGSQDRLTGLVVWVRRVSGNRTWTSVLGWDRRSL